MDRPAILEEGNQLELKIDDAVVEQAITHAATLAHPVFERMGWTYGRHVVGTPTLDELRGTIRYLVQEVLDGAEVASTGRFTVTGYDGQIEIMLDLATAYE
jgi:hypothetical protein